MNKKNLEQFMAYKEERLTKKIVFQNGDSVAFVLNFLPGQELPAHQHPGADVYIAALKGEGTIRIDAAEDSFAEGDVIHVAGEETLAYRNSGDQPASLYVVLAKIPSPAYAQEIN